MDFYHSAKGSSWKKHKYIRKEGDRYIYNTSKFEEKINKKTNTFEDKISKKTSDFDNKVANQRVDLSKVKVPDFEIRFPKINWSKLNPIPITKTAIEKYKNLEDFIYNIIHK